MQRNATYTVVIPTVRRRRSRSSDSRRLPRDRIHTFIPTRVANATRTVGHRFTMESLRHRRRRRHRLFMITRFGRVRTRNLLLTRSRLHGHRPSKFPYRPLSLRTRLILGLGLTRSSSASLAYKAICMYVPDGGGSLACHYCRDHGSLRSRVVGTADRHLRDHTLI